MKRAHYLRRERLRNRWRHLRRRVRLRCYDPSRVKVTFNGVELRGYSVGTLVRVEDDSFPFERINTDYHVECPVDFHLVRSEPVVTKSWTFIPLSKFAQ